MFDIYNKKDRLKQRFDTFRKEMRTDASKKINDVVTKNASVIDLSRVASRSAGLAREGSSPINAATVSTKKIVPVRNDRKDRPSGVAFTAPNVRQPRFILQQRIWWGVIGGVFVLALVLLTFVFDRATVVITPAEEHFLLQGVSVSVDTSLHSVDVAAKRLPGLRIEVAKSAAKTFPTSGKKYIQSRAEGLITITNAYSTKPQQLVQGTRFVEQGGKVFHLIHGVVVPGASLKNGTLIPSTIDAEVIADEPGDGYNISSAHFKIPGFAGTPKYDAFSAVSRNAFGGGFVGEARFATDDDIRRASEQVTKDVYDAIKTELAGKIPSGFVAPDGSRLIQITDVKKPLGLMIGDAFDFSASANGFIILFKQSDFAQLLEAVVVPPEKVMLFQQDKSGIAFSKIAIKQGGTGFDAVLDGDALFRYRIDADGIIKKIVSLSRDDANQWLRTRPDIGSFELKMFPVWIRTTPSSANSVRVEVVR